MAPARNAPADRRRSHRLSYAAPVLLQSRDSVSLAVMGTISEVSTHGCRVQAPRPFMAGLRLTLQLPSSWRLASARVVRSIPAVAGGWTVALEFEGAGWLVGAICSPRRRNGLLRRMPVLQAAIA